MSDQYPATDPDRLCEDWLAKARLARDLMDRGEPLPAWSVGEFLAVGLILWDDALLADQGYHAGAALERLRYDIKQPTALDAAKVFTALHVRLHEEGECRGPVHR